MRILTWNCQGALAKKLNAVAALRPDIAIIPECEPPDRLRRAGVDVPIVWHSDLPKKGLAIIAFSGAPLAIDPTHDPSIKHLLPVRVGGARPFHLLAVWTKETDDRQASYVGQACLAIDKYAAFFAANDTVAAGDFNSHPIFDRPGRPHSHAAMVSRLSHHGLLSAYHHYFMEPQGREIHKTFYMWRRQDRGFHIDYCFLPRAWLPYLKSVSVGDYRDWHTLSDHCPIVIDLDFASRQPATSQLLRRSFRRLGNLIGHWRTASHDQVRGRTGAAVVLYASFSIADILDVQKQ